MSLVIACRLVLGWYCGGLIVIVAFVICLRFNCCGGLGIDCVGLVGFWCLLRFVVLGGDWFDSVCGVFLLRVIGLGWGCGRMLLVVLAVCSFA